MVSVGSPEWSGPEWSGITTCEEKYQLTPAPAMTTISTNATAATTNPRRCRRGHDRVAMAGGGLGFHVECRLCGCDNRRVRYRWLLAGLGMFAGTLVLTTALIGLAAASGPVSASGPAAGPVRYRPIGCVRRGPAVAYSHGPRRKEVALSFDDGPFPLTPSFVRMLKANHAVATFFMIGEQVTARYRSTLASKSCATGTRWAITPTPIPTSLTAGGVQSQLQRTIERDSRPVRLHAVRVPPALRRLRQLGDADRRLARPGDDPVGSRPQRLHTPRRLGDRAARARTGQTRRSVLSHDGGGPGEQTLAAYPYIIRALRARGYRFVTVPELLGFHTVYRKCVRDCEGAAITGHPPPGSIIKPG